MSRRRQQRPSAILDRCELCGEQTESGRLQPRLSRYKQNLKPMRKAKMILVCARCLSEHGHALREPTEEALIEYLHKSGRRTWDPGLAAVLRAVRQVTPRTPSVRSISRVTSGGLPGLGKRR